MPGARAQAARRIPPQLSLRECHSHRAGAAIGNGFRADAATHEARKINASGERRLDPNLAGHAACLTICRRDAPHAAEERNRAQDRDGARHLEGTMHARIAGITSRVGRCRRGSALVEMALVTPLLLVLFSAVFEFGRMFHTRLTARHAVIEATRYAVTGNRLSDPDTGDPIDRAASIRRILAGRAYTLPVQPEAVTIDPADGGGPEDVVTVTLTYTYDYAMPGFMDVLPELQFTVAASMRNEPYFPDGEM